MILREVGERARGEGNAIDAMLFEAVARRFHRCVRDALLSERGQSRVNGRRIGRGVAKIDDAVWSDGAKRAEARGTFAGVRPDLAEEVDGRAFAVGAGDRDDRLRAARIEFRGGERERIARFSSSDVRNAGIGDQIVGGEHGNGAVRFGLRDVIAAMRGDAFERGKQKAWLHFA